jgi:hypothetical protein
VKYAAQPLTDEVLEPAVFLIEDRRPPLCVELQDLFRGQAKT